MGNGDGTFTLKSTTPTPSGGNLVLADFNHDGKLDFATSGNLLALGNGDGTFQTPTDIVANLPPYGFSGIAAGDINNDGWPDLVLTNTGDDSVLVTVLLNNHQGGFVQVPTKFGNDTFQPVLADLNGDGNLDLILASYRGVAIYLGNGKGEFDPQVTLGSSLDGIVVSYYLVADVNGDGVPDICVLAGSTMAIYLGEGGATYAAPFSIGAGPGPGSILVENLHGQSPEAHLPDIVVPDTSGGVMVLLNQTSRL